MTQVKIKRIYEKSSDNDGYRILVDRLWPRGVSKEEANLDEWFKDLGPTNELRKWFNHDATKFDQFKEKYKRELEEEEQQNALQQLKQLAKEKKTTLLFAAREEQYNHVQVLREIIEDE